MTDMTGEFRLLIIVPLTQLVVSCIIYYSFAPASNSSSYSSSQHLVPPATSSATVPAPNDETGTQSETSSLIPIPLHIHIPTIDTSSYSDMEKWNMGSFLVINGITLLCLIRWTEPKSSALSLLGGLTVNVCGVFLSSLLTVPAYLIAGMGGRVQSWGTPLLLTSLTLGVVSSSRGMRNILWMTRIIASAPLLKHIG